MPERYINGGDNEALLAKAAGIIRGGGLVAFPTETVYGLGADAFNPEAVLRVYAAKGRPADNPLILHILPERDLARCAAFVPEGARRLMKAFWPGPLTIVLKKGPEVPGEATAGLETAALRMPGHPAALDLIKHAGTPIAAPSANPSGHTSPTEAAHVAEDLRGKVDMVIDGGPCAFGIESAIVDMSGEAPRILRPGSITRSMIENVLGTRAEACGDTEVALAPGMKYAHYAPKARLTIVTGRPEDVAAYINEECRKQALSGEKAGVLAPEETAGLYHNAEVVTPGRRGEPETVAQGLYGALRRLDALGVRAAYSEGFYDSEVGLSIMNRLEKAAGYRIIEV